MAYKHSLTTYQPYDGLMNANSSDDDSQKIEDRQIISNVKDRALFFESPAERYAIEKDSVVYKIWHTNV